jgi:hypothetical protein
MLISSIGGALVLWLLIDKIAWGYLARVGGIKPKGKRVLTLPLGILERILYTGVFILGTPSWVAVWLGVKVAVQWDRWKGEDRATYNVFLIGNAMSIIFGFIGAWIALCECPELLAK